MAEAPIRAEKSPAEPPRSPPPQPEAVAPPAAAETETEGPAIADPGLRSAFVRAAARLKQLRRERRGAAAERDLDGKGPP